MPNLQGEYNEDMNEDNYPLDRACSLARHVLDHALHDITHPTNKRKRKEVYKWVNKDNPNSDFALICNLACVSQDLAYDFFETILHTFFEEFFEEKTCFDNGKVV
jgi:hypothetical protein